MGNNDTRTIARFLQSSNDFPCPVELGSYAPSFRLHRYRQGLRFVPLDDEGFTVRGDKQRLVYKGRKRSHRFTICGDTVFEYDCILLKEPESNVIALRIEGAEHYDFFRQPDFLKNPLLAGSYAVYKKQTWVGEGTGKLCHIHRPELIDNRGRRCWGDLSVVEDMLYITIPEEWLGEASYPVIVDPVIGTSTVGNQSNRWETVHSNGIEHYGIMGGLAVNKFMLPDILEGTLTAFVYCNSTAYTTGVRPIIYSDNNDVPLSKLSNNEQLYDTDVSSYKPRGWRPANFDLNSSLPSGSNVWFGISAGLFNPLFDYGQKMYWFSYDNMSSQRPETFPLYQDNRFYDYKLSTYFEYKMGENYTSVITQGITLTDSVSGLRKVLRSLGDLIQIGTETKHGWAVTTKISDTVSTAASVFRGLLLSVRIVTGVFVRDYLLGRFLKARSELALKSCVSNELTLDSKIC